MVECKGTEETMEIYLIRHGETEWNRLGRLQGHSDIPLNDAGLAQARKAARYLKDTPFDEMLASPLARAKKTAEIIHEGRTCPLYTNPLLSEISFGDAEGFQMGNRSTDIDRKMDDQIRQFFENPDTNPAIPNSEPIRKVLDRAEHFMKEILLPMEERMNRVLIATHGGFSRAMLLSIRGGEPADFWKGPILPNCGAVVITLKNGIFTIGQTLDLVGLGSGAAASEFVRL